MANRGTAAVTGVRRMLIVILLIALGLRVAAACGLQYLLDYRWHRPFLISGDAEGYWELAQRLAAGEDYAVYTPPRYALRMPGFPAVLAIPVALCGPSLLMARLFLAGMGTLACGLVYGLGRQMFDARVGLVAAGLAAISPVLIVFSETILSETAFAVTLLWSLWAGQNLYRRLTVFEAKPNTILPGHPTNPVPSGDQTSLVFRDAVHTGVAIAAGVMMRPSWILAAPVVAVLLMLTVTARWRAALAGAVIIGAMVLALLPWGIRNQQVTGHFTLTTFWMGPSLYDGLNPDATGDSNMTFYDQDNLMRTMGEFEVDQHYRQAARKFVIEHPQRTAMLAMAKAARYWSPWPNAEQFSQWWAKSIVSLFFIPSFLLALWGGACLFMRSRNSGSPPLPDSRMAAIWSMAILAGPIFYFAVIHMVFVSSLRYRLPAEYPMLILTALGLVQLWNRWRPHSV